MALDFSDLEYYSNGDHNVSRYLSWPLQSSGALMFCLCLIFMSFLVISSVIFACGHSSGKRPRKKSDVNYAVWGPGNQEYGDGSDGGGGGGCGGGGNNN
ncbi:hypothetical protein PanWU01x14_276560 [Parasponia andersonii]|uniref:Transmembrane protein n=1 Tax=Parasponia andersonii TaxID=3476 RepID=A0A2P5B2S0_PARAD|nr:hypothetical protein PanWU01x14_276560 [Parasponia andersonii]